MTLTECFLDYKYFMYFTLFAILTITVTLHILAGKNVSNDSSKDSRTIGRMKHNKSCVVQNGECIQGECMYYMKGNIVKH